MTEKPAPAKLQKSPTGIRGLDEITGGGFPKGRSTLISGEAGSGKTLMAMEFIVRGILQYNEPGVFMSFEENAEDLKTNFASLGVDLNRLVKEKKLVIDQVQLDRSTIEEAGAYDLEGLFIRLNHAIDSIGARRVAIDTVEVIFSGFSNMGLLRSELRRLFQWLREKEMTAVITAEKGEKTLTRFGLEEYVADCVLMLDHRVQGQLSTRRLRVVKYRGSNHGTNEYPFLVEKDGISILPITTVGLDYAVSDERISTGIPRLDDMLEGKGYFRGGSILISGGAGTGKTNLVLCFINAACRKGERCLYVASEESTSQVLRNVRSIGINLEPWIRKGLLRMTAYRPTYYGLEKHLISLFTEVETFSPTTVVFDPISNLTQVGSSEDVKAMLIRIIDYLKGRQITTICTDLARGRATPEETEIGISSLMDMWVILREIEINNERNRGLYVLKSRGMAHSSQIRELLITGKGLDLRDVYVGPTGVLTGSARDIEEMKEKAETQIQRQEIERLRKELERKRAIMEAKTRTLRLEFEAEEEALTQEIARGKLREEIASGARTALTRLRQPSRTKRGGAGSGGGNGPR